jgi:hypothetical protein
MTGGQRKEEPLPGFQVYREKSLSYHQKEFTAQGF